MVVKSKTAYKLLFNVAGVLALVPMYLKGWLSQIVTSDQTGLSLAIGTIFLFGVVLSLLNMWKTVHFIAEGLLHLGLIGTVLGFIIAFSGVVPDMAFDFTTITAMVTTLVAGIGTAMYTTLVGAIGFLWLRLNEGLFGVEVV